MCDTLGHKGFWALLYFMADYTLHSSIIDKILWGLRGHWHKDIKLQSVNFKLCEALAKSTTFNFKQATRLLKATGSEGRCVIYTRHLSKHFFFHVIYIVAFILHIVFGI